MLKNGIRLITRIHLLIASEKNSLEDAQCMHVFLIAMKKKIPVRKRSANKVV